jgi:hypothetical protein
VLWLVLAFFLMIGTVAAAFVVYGVTGMFATGAVLPGLPIAIGGAIVASLAMLLLVGMLYRIDRLRGVPHREVRLFE